MLGRYEHQKWKDSDREKVKYVGSIYRYKPQEDDHCSSNSFVLIAMQNICNIENKVYHLFSI